MLKRIVVYGELSRPAKTAGWALLVLAAVCCLTGGFLTLRQTFQFGRQLQQAQMSQAQMQQAVIEMTRFIGIGQWLYWTAMALVFLSLGCFLFGRRTPPALPDKEP
jgi:hypothetical protein